MSVTLKDSAMLGVAVAAAIMTIGGCVSQRSVGDTEVFTPAGWFPLLVLAGAVGLGVLGWWMYKSAEPEERWKAWGAFITGGVVLIGALPGSFLNHVTVDSQGLRVRDSFFWFLPNAHQIAFDKVHRVDQQTKTSGGKRRTVTHYLVFRHSGGQDAWVEQGMLVAKAKEAILARVRAAKIPIYVETNTDEVIGMPPALQDGARRMVPEAGSAPDNGGNP